MQESSNTLARCSITTSHHKTFPNHLIWRYLAGLFTASLTFRLNEYPLGNNRRSPRRRPRGALSKLARGHTRIQTRAVILGCLHHHGQDLVL